ncbi:hypothetical protein [Nocardioides dongkuii]|uniref:hypothetical protein n=1 Tax=Nocardioides dongkuii TaxID=2760089 RepID=UPI0015FDF88C|nr:hypothetical protein [Nocardioides dongkuii]
MSATTLPIPLRFELPGPEWGAVDPESWGVQNASFLAVRRGLDEDYSPTITVSGGWRNDSTPLEEIADEALAKLRAEGATEVELVQRRVTGSEHDQAVVQSVGCTVEVEGRRFDVRQAQVFRGFVDVRDPARRVVVVHTLSCTYRQFEEMGREFQQFMATVEVVPDGQVDWPAADGEPHPLPPQ